MLRRDRALWAFAVILSIALLIAPALWNGFALLQWDSGGYLARWYEGYLVPSRAVVYGLMLNAGAPLAFWPVLLLQSALTIWIFALMLRAHGLGARPLLLLGIVAALSVLTTLPWLTSILLTDIFCGLSVMALYLLLLRDETLKRYERASLIALIAVSAATHNATLAVLLGLLAAATLSRFVRGELYPARSSRPRRAGAGARLCSGVCRRLCRGQAAGMDAGRLRAVVRPHAAGRHRQEISRRALSRSRPEKALRPQRRAAKRRRRLVLGQPGLRQPRTFCRARSGDGESRSSIPGRIPRPANRNRRHCHRQAIDRRAHRRRRSQHHLAHLPHH